MRSGHVTLPVFVSILCRPLALWQTNYDDDDDDDDDDEFCALWLLWRPRRSKLYDMI